MAKAKKENIFEGYIRVHDPDKDRLAELVVKGRGPRRTLLEYADACGVNSSTLSRIVNKKNSGPSSDRLIAMLALNADPSSGVTIEKLLDAHGLAPVEGKSVSPREALMKVAKEDYIPPEDNMPGAEELLDKSREARRCRAAVQNSLLELGYTLSLAEDQTAIRGVEFDCYATFSFQTDALAEEGLERWAFLRIKEEGNRAGFALTSYFGMMYLHNPVKDGVRVTVITEDELTYLLVRDMYRGTEIPSSFSIMQISTAENRIVHEFVFDRNDGVEPVRLFDVGGEIDYQEVYGVPDDDDF